MALFIKKQEKKMLFSLLTVFLCTLGSFATKNNNDVTLTSGLQDFDRVQLDHQYNLFSLYKNMHIIRSSSMLIYNIDTQGNLDTYKTNDSATSAEYFQSLLKNNLGLYAYPCLYCDATAGFCSDLNMRLEKMYKNQTRFILDLVERTMVNGWHGLYFDFEPDGAIDWDKLTHFLIDISHVLNVVQLPVYVWVGHGTSYDHHLLLSATNIKLVSMDTYQQTYADFVVSAVDNVEQLTSNANKLVVGLLTSEPVSQEDMFEILKWCTVANITTINLYASTISGFAFEALQSFLK